MIICWLNTYLVSSTLLLVHLVFLVDLNWVLKGVHRLIILTTHFSFNKSCGDRHGLLPAEGCGQGETVWLLLLSENIKVSRWSFLLEGVANVHIVQDHHTSFFVLFLYALVNLAFLIRAHEGHLEIAVSAFVESYFSYCWWLITLQVVVSIKAITGLCRRRALPEARLSLR